MNIGNTISNHLSTDPRPPWTTLPPMTQNSLNGAREAPDAFVSYTPILTIRVDRNTNPSTISLFFESYPSSHLFPLVTVDPNTRQVIIKFRHSSFHKGLLGLFDEQGSMGGPVKEQYVMTTTKHEFLLPEGYSCTDWSWKRFRAGGGEKGGSARGGTHVLELIFYSEEEEFEDEEEVGKAQQEEWSGNHEEGYAEFPKAQQVQVRGDQGYYGRYIYEEGDAQMDIDIESDLLLFD